MPVLTEDQYNDAAAATDLYAPLWYGNIDRAQRIYFAQSQLLFAAKESAQPASTAIQRVDDLFTTYVNQTVMFMILGLPDLADAIQADVTYAWLDTIYPLGSGVTLRTRLVNQFTL